MTEAIQNTFTKKAVPNIEWEEIRRDPWEKLIGHHYCIRNDTTLVEARNFFRQHNIGYMAVLQGREVLGICSYAQVSEVLSRGHQGLGFSIYERRMIADFLVSECFFINVNDPVHQVLDRLAERNRQHFFDDVVVLNTKKQFLGIITAHDLVHFQQNILKDQHEQLQINIVELKALTEQLNQTNNKLEELNEEKNEFLGIAAHDLKNPINIINMSTDMILTEEGMPVEEQHRLLRDIGNSCDRMIKLLGDLLDINRIENKKMCVELLPHYLEDLVSPTIECYSIQVDKKSIKIHFECENEAPCIRVDESLFLQVFDNLISNAIKFSPCNKNIFITLKTKETTGVLMIKDEGPGFSEIDKTKMFQKFSRLSAKPTGNENSTGLGLSIVKRLVEVMKGRIELQSVLGQGATFILEFPLGNIG